MSKQEEENTDVYKKPPMGLHPEWWHKEDRIEEINDAIERYTKAKLYFPVEWLIERKDLIAWIKLNKPDSPHAIKSYDLQTYRCTDSRIL